MTMKTQSDVIELARQVEIKQKGEKREAINRVVDAYEYALHKPRILFSVVPNVVCRICGGIILQRESYFPMITPGGNRIIGCVKCKTLSYKLINPDIIRDNNNTNDNYK